VTENRSGRSLLRAAARAPASRAAVGQTARQSLPTATDGGAAVARASGGTTSTGQPAQDLTAAAESLAAGRQVRVTLSPASGLPAGTRGVLVRLLDPAAGAECVVVRVDGDELPFAPAEVRAGWPRRVEAVPPAAAAPPHGPAPGRPSEEELAAAMAYAEGAPQPTRAVLAAVPDAADPPAGSGGAAVPDPDRSTAGQSQSGQSGRGQGQRRGRVQGEGGPARKPGRRAVPRLEVTLRHGADGWTVGAAAGARVLVRPTPVDPAAAVAVADLLDAPAVSTLVGEIVDRARAEAEARVEGLAAQLAAAEAELQAFRAAPPGPLSRR